MRGMPMHRSPRRLRLVLASAMLLPLILSGCETLRTLTRAPSIQTAQGDERPIACVTFQVIHFSTGKPGVTVDDVKAQLTRDNPVSRVRNFVGDTTQTIAQIKEQNAVWHALCDPK